MADQTPAPPAAPDGNRIQVDIAEEMRGSYLAYAMSVIVGRALPDVRDGLKPVHRRVLFAMHEQRNVYNAAYKKSARIVGDVIGKYHPHGDQSVYDTIVRLAQPFSMRYLLVDGQGNFGSVDGDPAAAMRYTEVRMTRLAGELLADIEKETIDWQPNYDGSEREPTVLPSAFPNLLVNGSGGIAVGMATNMPPHNLREAIAATIAIIENPDISTRELLQIIPGPDFPTGGTIYGRAGIYQAYETGRGKLTVRAVAEFEYDDKGDERAIIVKELPYQVNKAQLLEYIAELVRDKKIDGIRDLRDESDREGMRMVIELKRGAMAQIVLNQLYKMTQLQTTFGIINLAIVAGQPKILGLKELLTHFINHRRDVVTRRCRYELAKARDRAHLLEGYLRAIDIIDEIVQLIKGSATPADAKEGLVSRFGFTEVQAQAILDLTLKRLTGLERDKILEELTDLRKKIAELEAILASDELLMQVIVDELKRINDMAGDARRTSIIDASGEIAIEDLISNEPMVVTITTTGYIKRTALTEYRTQRRGGRGRSGMSTKDEDNVSHLFVATAHALLLVFTDRGQVYPLKVWEVPAGGITSSGKAIVNLLQLEDGEKVRAIVPIESLDEPGRFLVFATRAGQIKRTALDQFKNIRAAGLRAINLADDDDLVAVKLASEGECVVLATAHGQALAFRIEQTRALGRATQGVRGIRLRKGDSLVGLAIVEGLKAEEDENLDASEGDEREDAEPVEPEVEADAGDEAGEGAEGEEIAEGEQTLLFISQNGFGKRTALHHFRLKRRGGMGVRALKFSERNGPLVSMAAVEASDDLMVVTDGGTIVRIPVEQVRAMGRSAQGVRIISVRDEKVVGSYAVPSSDAEPVAPAGAEEAVSAEIDKDLDDLVGAAGGSEE
ncbi:MAG: DNA gyrase subunit A [Deltaproteobacteria bacterium]|nr:DNA gyrase subunit A [Deltaproteobacteria bacterium]